MNYKNFHLRLIGFWLCLIVFSLGIRAAEELPFEKDIAAYEKKFQENPPAENSTFFVGSSTWTLWGKQLEEDFASLQAVNTGFGGATIPDLLRAVDRIVIPHKPKRILFFCGGNDVARKMEPGVVLDNFKKYLAKIWAVNPLCEVYFVSITQAPARKEFWPQTRQLNDEIRQLAEKLDGLYFIDTRPAMSDENGDIREDLFLSDRLHLNRQAQEIWIPIILDAVKNVTEKREKREKRDVTPALNVIQL